MLTNDSLAQEDVAKGAVTKHTWNTSRIYPNTTRNYWVYVPAQYADAEPACLMVFQDGEAYVHSEGLMRVPTVFDNLIHKSEMPMTIGIFIDPGEKEVAYDNRFAEYVTLGDTYAHFLLDEILPEVGKEYNLVDNAAGRRGSYTRLPGGSEYPSLIRNTRGDPRPIRVFLQDGENDLNIAEGSWTLANINMASALKYARYDYRFELGTAGHDLKHGGAIFPETLRWIRRDYPGVKGAGDEPALDSVIGQWDLVINAFGHVRHNELTVAEQGGALAAILTDEKDGEIEVTAVSFKDDILTYEYRTPQSQLNWGKPPNDMMTAWLKVTGSTLEGAHPISFGRGRS